MKSPFPGMDPYLEKHRGGVHTRITVAASIQLRRQVSSDLKIRIEEYITVEDSDTPYEERRYAPDVRVVERQMPTGGSVATAVLEPQAEFNEEPVIIPVELESPTQREIRILDSSNRGRIVTVIEFLSPTNKTSGRLDYRRKQREFLDGGVNLIEVDLLRAGRWVLVPDPEAVPNDCRGPYRVSVVRSAEPRQAEVYRASYAARLPRIRVPLRPTDDDARLDLQALIDQAYEDGGFEDIDYRQEPEPPFLPEEQAWADRLLREQGRR